MLFTATDLIKSNNNIIYFVTMVGNVPWSRANNTPWSLTMVTHHGDTITDHGQTCSAIKNYGTMIKLLRELLLLFVILRTVPYIEVPLYLIANVGK